MNGMDDLITRLLAAIDAKEAKARAAKPGPWLSGTFAEHLLDTAVYGQSGWPEHIENVCNTDYSGPTAIANGVHIADNGPDIVLRRCAADRRIVGRHVKVVEMWDQGDERGLFDVEICRTCAYGTSCGHCFDRDDLPLVAWPCPDLIDLAEVYGITVDTATP